MKKVFKIAKIIMMLIMFFIASLTLVSYIWNNDGVGEIIAVFGLFILVCIFHSDLW